MHRQHFFFPPLFACVPSTTPITQKHRAQPHRAQRSTHYYKNIESTNNMFAAFDESSSVVAPEVRARARHTPTFFSSRKRRLAVFFFFFFFRETNIRFPVITNKQSLLSPSLRLLSRYRSSSLYTHRSHCQHLHNPGARLVREPCSNHAHGQLVRPPRQGCL